MASTDVAVVARAPTRSRLIAFLEREGLAVGVVAVLAAGLAYRLPSRLAQDAWLALVAGREVWHHGPPTIDTLTYWTAGKHWVDQQWLGQALSYGIYSAGGLRLFALTHVLLVTLALGLAVLAARRRGASPRAICWLGIGGVYLLALAGGHVRTQTFAYPLFSLVLLLLLRDRRQPTIRTLAVLPLLVLWANLHGSVVLGAALVGLYGATLLARRTQSRVLRARGAVLLLGSGLALIATPWGLDTIGYYRSTLFNAAFKTVVSEWRPPTLTLMLAPFFLLAGIGLWLLGRRHRRFGAFEASTLILLTALALTAQRNIVWLALAAVPLLAPVLDDVLPTPSRPIRAQVNVAFGLAASVFACFAVLSAAARGESWYRAPWPARAADAAASAAASDTRARIYANERYADWLLMSHPELAGRIAYDIRFELLTAKQLLSIARWHGESGPGWIGAAGKARIIVLALPTEAQNERGLLAKSGNRVLYRDSRIAVLLRPRSPGRP